MNEDNDFHSYYQSRSKQESVAMAAWCFVACAVLSVLAVVYTWVS